MVWRKEMTLIPCVSFGGEIKASRVALGKQSKPSSMDDCWLSLVLCKMQRKPPPRSLILWRHVGKQSKRKVKRYMWQLLLLPCGVQPGLQKDKEEECVVVLVGMRRMKEMFSSTVSSNHNSCGNLQTCFIWSDLLHNVFRELKTPKDFQLGGLCAKYV